MEPTRLARFGALVPALVAAAGASAQWSTSPSANFKVCDHPGDKNDSHLAPTSDGGAYIAWFDNGRTNYKSDTWTWSGTAWTLTGAAGPAPRARHAMAYDSARQRTVLFGGGNGGGVLGDVWEWNGTSWAPMSIANSAGPRERHAMAYDALHGQVVIFGGADGGGTLLGETWTYDGTAMVHQSPANSPSPRRDTAMAYDSVRQVVVLFGGSSGAGYEGDTWEWNGSAWTQAAPGASPPARAGHGMAFDPVSGKVLLFGGTNGAAQNDTWLYDGATWALQAPATSPAARAGCAAANEFTASGVRTVVFGGNSGTFNLASMFEWSGTNWASKSSTPTARNNPAMAYDAARSNTVLFGGVDIGGYDVALQRVNGHGVEQWPHDGLTIRDRGVSSTVGYDMTIDADGNALIAYNNDQLPPGGLQQIEVAKVDPTGAVLWTTVVSAITSGQSVANPKVCALSDGNYAVAWSYSLTSTDNRFQVQKLSSSGVPQFSGTGLLYTDTGHYTNVSDIKPGDNGSYVVMWIRGTSTSATNSSKHLLAMKYDGSGAPLWTPSDTTGNSLGPVTGVVVYMPAPGSAYTTNGGGGNYNATNGGSIQNGYQPTMIPDGNGGVVVGWYETAGPRNAYIQHILPAGALKFATNGVSATFTAATRIRTNGVGFAYNAASGEYFLSCPETDSSTQTQNSFFVQRFDPAGTRQWGNSGVTIIPINSFQPSFPQCQVMGDGCLVACLDTRNPSSTVRVVDSARVNAAGTVLWHNLVNSDAATNKGRLASTMSTRGFAILSYNWGASGAADIGLQNLNPDGSLGDPPCYADVNGDGVLDSNDFNAFLIKFLAQDPSADCNADGTWDSNDFNCLLVKFLAGCP